MASELKLLDGGISLKMGYWETSPPYSEGSVVTTVAQLTVFFDDAYPSAVLATDTGIVEVNLTDLVELLKVIKKNT